MKNSIVIDLNYGDSGKGLTVDWLASSYEYELVTRYSGGSQCGHGVRHKKNDNPEGLFHEFQTWGSGTLRNITSYLTEDVVFDPISVIKEFNVLRSKVLRMPAMYIHPKSPVITPYEVYTNQNDNDILNNGTCGRGIFTTKQREKNHHHIQAIDLLYPSILKLKIEELKKYYKFPIEKDGEFKDLDLTEFYNSVEKIRNGSCNIYIREGIPEYFKEKGIIFESSQGLMLDEKIGIFPHCTPSKLDIPDGYDFSEIYIVTRAYHTRHGNGPLTTEQYPIQRSKWETNFDNAYQGMFRCGILDLDVLRYSLASSNIPEYRNKNREVKLNLVITHLDVVRNDWRFIEHGELRTCSNEHDFITSIKNTLVTDFNQRIDLIYVNDSPFTETFRKFQ